MSEVPTSWGDGIAGLVVEATDPARFDRGERLLREGAVRDVRTARGSLVATVRGSGRNVYQVAMAVRPLGAAEAARLVRAVTAEPALLLRLLAGQDPAAARALGRSAAVELVPPSSRLLHFACSCPDPVEPCKHAVALALAGAELVDATPALWLLLRDVPLDDLAADLLPEDADPLEERLEDFWEPRGTPQPLPAPRRSRAAVDERDEDLLRALLRPDLPRVRRGAGPTVEERLDGAEEALRALYRGIVRVDERDGG
ncbi:hypothetical protein NUM3379_15310 [Kineococcus sp. NUM-3379]